MGKWSYFCQRWLKLGGHHSAQLLSCPGLARLLATQMERLPIPNPPREDNCGVGYLAMRTEPWPRTSKPAPKHQKAASKVLSSGSAGKASKTAAAVARRGRSRYGEARRRIASGNQNTLREIPEVSWVKFQLLALLDGLGCRSILKTPLAIKTRVLEHPRNQPAPQGVFALPVQNSTFTEGSRCLDHPRRAFRGTVHLGLSAYRRSHCRPRSHVRVRFSLGRVVHASTHRRNKCRVLRHALM